MGKLETNLISLQDIIYYYGNEKNIIRKNIK